MILNELFICYKKNPVLRYTTFYNLNTKLSFSYSSIINTGWFKNADLLSTLYVKHMLSLLLIL